MIHSTYRYSSPFRIPEYEPNMLTKKWYNNISYRYSTRISYFVLRSCLYVPVGYLLITGVYESIAVWIWYICICIFYNPAIVCSLVGFYRYEYYTYTQKPMPAVSAFHLWRKSFAQDGGLSFALHIYTDKIFLMLIIDWLMHILVRFYFLLFAGARVLGY